TGSISKSAPTGPGATGSYGTSTSATAPSSTDVAGSSVKMRSGRTSGSPGCGAYGRTRAARWRRGPVSERGGRPAAGAPGLTGIGRGAAASATDAAPDPAAAGFDDMVRPRQSKRSAILRSSAPSDGGEPPALPPAATSAG